MFILHMNIYLSVCLAIYLSIYVHKTIGLCFLESQAIVC